MTSYCLRAIAVTATLAAASIPTSAIAAPFDGYWSLVAQTTNGHCGVTQWDVAISGGRLYYPGGQFMGYPVGLAGAVSPAGRVRVRVTAGPRVADGRGRLGRVQGGGEWGGQGPSGICSGVWTATRVQPSTGYAPPWGTNYGPPWGANYAPMPGRPMPGPMPPPPWQWSPYR